MKDDYYGHSGMSKTARVLRILKNNGSATNKDLNRICFRYGARIHELRNEGWVIDSNRLEGGLWEFIFHGHVSEDTQVMHS